MFLSRFKAFVFQKGIGLKIIIPLSFLVAILLSLQIVSPFQKSLETQEIQSLVSLIATPDSDIKNIQESLKIEKINAKSHKTTVTTSYQYGVPSFPARLKINEHNKTKGTY